MVNNIMKDLQKMKILAIDDEPRDLKLIEAILEKNGYKEIQTAGSGEGGLELVKNNSPDLVLLDIIMPGMTGYEFCQKLRANEATTHIPVLMVTGGPSEADEAIKKSFHAGATDFITKPINSIEFLARVKSALIIKHTYDRMKEELYKREQAEEALRESDRMKTEFISTASHELRTPLTSIKNAIAIVLNERAGPINENQNRFLSMANINVDRLSGLVNELLDLSKIESGGLKIELRPLDLSVHLDMAITSLRSRAREKSISIHKEIPSGLPMACGDSDKVEQIFINLLDNAIKFTPKGGEVHVSAKGYELDGDFIEISVADTGIGIHPDQLAKIFSRFYQTEGSLTRELGGAGLGLSIVQGLVEIHGGKARVESDVGRGSKFTFTLPKYSQAIGLTIED